MPRTLKPQKVDEHLDPRVGTPIDILLDRNDLNFFATFEGETVRDADARKIPGKLRALIDVVNLIEWQRAIELHRVYPSSGGAAIQLWHTVFDWGYRKDGRLMQRGVHFSHVFPNGVHHDTPRPWSLRHTSFEGVFQPPMRLAGVDYLIYDADVDEGLKKLEAAILQIRKRVDALIELPDGGAAHLKAFALGTAPMLPSIAGEESDDATR